MNHEGRENQGTGLRNVFDILVKAATQRLLSLTFQLGESVEDNIIHALCLIILQKEERALNRLETLKNDCVATFLAEKWQMSGGKLEDFAVHCGHFKAHTGESLAALARIFKVLSEQRLCDPCLRNLAYKRALSSDDQKTNSCEDLQYNQLREEAKVVCGPQFAEWLCSSKELKSGSYHEPPGSLDEGNATLKVSLSQDQSDRAHTLPSPLQATTSMPSYPTHLEISLPPTALFQEDKTTPEASKLKTHVLLLSEGEAKSDTSQLLGAKKHSDDTCAAEGSIITQKKTKPTAELNLTLPTATNTSLPTMPFPNEMHESKDADEEEEAVFYVFVIFHAPEDADVAESMREHIETLIGEGEGATFSGDFAIPGRSALRCVDDAINNSAFTLLLLTRNFNTRLLEVEADSALINSINKKHKYNTVIPVLPRENCMPRANIPIPLQRIIPLEQNARFEKKIQKVFSPAKIKAQRKNWTAEQKVKMMIERQERLKSLSQHQKQLIQECTTAQILERETMLLAQKLVLGPKQDGMVLQQQQPNIRIENAQYIMIGNDSQMTVGLGGGADSSVYREEEQRKD